MHWSQVYWYWAVLSAIGTIFSGMTLVDHLNKWYVIIFAAFALALLVTGTLAVGTL